MLFAIHQQAWSQDNIGILNLEQLLANANYTKQEYKKLNENENFKKLTQTILDLQKEVQALRKKGETQSLTWSEEKKQQHQQEGQKKLDYLNQLAAEQRKVRSDLNLSIEKKLLPEVRLIIDTIAKEKGLDLILNSQTILFGSEKMDLTKEVITRLNNAK